MARIPSPGATEFEVSISNRTLWRIIGSIVAAILLFAIIRQSFHTLTLIGVAIFLSLALNGPVHWVADHLPGRLRGRRGFATGLSIGIVVVFVAGFLALIVPPLVSQTSHFIQHAPQLIDDLRSQNTSLGRFVQSHHLQSQIDKLSQQLSSHVGDIGGSAWSTVTKIGSSLFATLTVLVLTIMMLAEGPRWRRIFEQLVPSRHNARTQRLAHDMNLVIRGYVNGQVLLAGLAAILIVPILVALHIPSPLALMVVVFVCGLIPMVGHTIGAIIVTTVALFQSVPAAIIVLAYYILYQQIENYVVQPRIQANATNMSALLVFTSVIIGANFGGLLGALVAIPIAGCIRVAVLDYLESRDILSKRVVAKEKAGK